MTHTTDFWYITCDNLYSLTKGGKNGKRVFLLWHDGEIQDRFYTGPRYGTVVVSKTELPEFSKEREWKCAYYSPNIPLDTPLGSIIDVAIGDPRILKECKLISWNLDGAPINMIDTARKYKLKGLTLEYKGEKILAYLDWLCLEKDL